MNRSDCIAGNSHKTESDDEEKGSEGPGVNERSIEVAGPIALWAGLIVIGMLLKLFVVPALNGSGLASYGTLLGAFATYLLYLPGPIIIALIVAVVIGDRIGRVAKKYSETVSRALVNALYTIFIYLVMTTIIYLLATFAAVGGLGILLWDFVLYMAILPSAILIVVVPLFAILSYARRA